MQLIYGDTYLSFVCYAHKYAILDDCHLMKYAVCGRYYLSFASELFLLMEKWSISSRGWYVFASTYYLPISYLLTYLLTYLLAYLLVCLPT